MALSTIPHGRIALRPGTKSLEHSPSSVASIHRTASQGRMRRQSTKRRGARDELPGVGRLSVRHPSRGEAGKGAGWAPGHPFRPTCHISSSYSAFGLDKRRKTSKIYACRDTINGRVSPRSPYSLRPIWITPGTAALGARVRRGADDVVGIDRGERQTFTG